MKENNFYNFILTILILIILKTRCTETSIKTCSIYRMKLFGVKLHCESKTEDSISCVDPYVSKVYQQCKKDYFNEENITQKIIHCKDDGSWSDESLECSAECIEFPNELELLSYNQLKFPTSYVELSRKKPIEGQKNRYPGIILSETEILTSNIDFQGIYYLTIYKSGEKYKKYDLYLPQSIKYVKYNSRTKKDDIVLTINTNSDFYIKYDADTKPACGNMSTLSDIPQYSSPYNSMIRTDRCYVPKVDNVKVQMICMDYDAKIPIKCLKTVSGIELRCQVGYKNSNLDPGNDILSKCTRGVWEVFGEEDDCKLICGQIAEDIKPYSTKLLYKANSTNIVNAPWHVGIYAINTNTSLFEQVCGGTIIHSNVVISAAHCFYDDAYSKLSSPTNFLVGAGKTYRSIDADEVASYAEIKDIHIPLHYQSAPVRNDIAVLILKTHLQYTSRIKPICIDWELLGNYDTTIGLERGQVVGWGATSKNDKSSPELLELNFETLSNNQCKNLVPAVFRSEITGDKFCATNTNGGVACKGDSGGGFVILKYSEDQYRYFLLGVVSIGLGRKKYCSDGFINMFTNIKLYKDFIEQAIAKKTLTAYGLPPTPTGLIKELIDLFR